MWNAMVPELVVTDVEDSLVFYFAAGFTVRFRRSDPEFVYLELGEAQLMLEQDHADSWKTAALQRPYGRGINLQIEVESVRAIAARFAALGIAMFRAPEEAWYATSETTEEGQIECLAQDPDGYLLRFVEVLGERSKP